MVPNHLFWSFGANKSAVSVKILKMTSEDKNPHLCWKCFNINVNKNVYHRCLESYPITFKLSLYLTKEISSGGWIILEVADVVAIRAGFLSDELKRMERETVKKSRVESIFNFIQSPLSVLCVVNYNKKIKNLLSIRGKCWFSCSRWKQGSATWLTIWPSGLTAVYHRRWACNARYRRIPGCTERSK